jgi:hypothetical protein
VRRPLAAANAEVARAIGGVVAHEFARLRADGISGQIQSALVDAMPSGRVDIDAIAAGLALSRRDLQRRLHAVGSSFRKEPVQRKGRPGDGHHPGRELCA